MFRRMPTFLNNAIDVSIFKSVERNSLILDTVWWVAVVNDDTEVGWW